MVIGNIVSGNNVVHLNIPLRQAATEAHTVPGIKNTLLSVNRLAAKKMHQCIQRRQAIGLRCDKHESDGVTSSRA